VTRYASRRFDWPNDAPVLVHHRTEQQTEGFAPSESKRGLRLSDLPVGIASTPKRSLASRSPVLSFLVFSDHS
jgi:hypothetical protein